MKSELPKIELEKWIRYDFESEEKYYIIMLQQDIFHEWVITKVYGEKNDKQDNYIVESCYSYEDVKNKIEAIKKIRKQHKYEKQ